MKDLSNLPIILSLFNMNHSGPKFPEIIIGLSIASIFILVGFMPMISGVPASELKEIITSIPGAEINAVNKTLEIEHIIRQMDETMLSGYIQKMQDFKTRYAYRGDRCNLAAEYIYTVFENNGLEVEYDTFVHDKYNMKNVVGTKPGVSTSDSYIIICAHYDSVSEWTAWIDAPGADDNGSGVAAVLAAAEILSDYDFNYTIKFITFSGEELWMQGSTHYRDEALANGDNITGVFNLDMIAYNPDPGSNYVRVRLEDRDPYDASNSQYSPASHNLSNMTVQIAQKYEHITNIQTINTTGGSSDHVPFNPIYPALMLHEDKFNDPNYHSTTDTIDKLNMTYCTNITQVAVATIAEFAEINSTDNMPPSHGPGFPPNNGYGQEQPSISLVIQDPAGINITGLEMFVNGEQITPILAPAPMGYNLTYIPVLAFSDGQLINISVKANDTNGAGFNYSWEFTVDALPPAPPTNFRITTSRVELIKQGLVMNVGPSAYDIKHVLAPSVIYHDGEYKMWYSGHNNSKYHICYANSSDGINWNKQGMVLYHGLLGEPDSHGAIYSEVLYDGEYKMWYSGSNGSKWQILYANSSDGITWTKYGLVIEAESLGWMNNMYSLHPSIIKDTEYKMWYSAVGDGDWNMIYANSSDGLNWTQYPVDMSPWGSGVIHGDAIVAYPEIVYDSGEYHMWYNRYDSRIMRTMYANSSDGQIWNDHGLTIDVNNTLGAPDIYRATHCSAMIIENETKVWYSGYNNGNWRIMYANLTPEVNKTDITLSWTPSTSSDIVRYEVFRESRPSAFGALEKVNPEFYSAFETQTPWTMETAAYFNTSVYGPVTATDPPYFYLPEDNVQEITLFIQKPGGEWIILVDGVDFVCDYVPGKVEISSPDFVTGSTIYATFNYSASKALCTTGSSITDNRAGEESAENYFYIIRAIDKVGHATRQELIVGKQATSVDAGWNLVCSPLLQDTTNLSYAMESLDWERARTWNPEKQPNHWTSHVPGRLPQLNTLNAVNDTDGIWVKSALGIYVTAGPVHNITYDLKIGWNLVSFPYYESRAISDVLVGLPWDRVEVFDPVAPYLIVESSGSLVPGQGFWVRLTSDAIWNAYNY